RRKPCFRLQAPTSRIGFSASVCLLCWSLQLVFFHWLCRACTKSFIRLCMPDLSWQQSRLSRSGKSSNLLGALFNTFTVGPSLVTSTSERVRPNNSFKPNLLRYTKAMAEKACHGFGFTTQVGLTQALGR